MPNEFNNYDNNVGPDSGIEPYQSPPPLNRSQKIAVAVLAFFGVFIVILWSWQFRNNLTQSLKHANTNSGNAADVNSNIVANDSNKDSERLKNQDTDGDGFSDWDELNVYHTSPYLEDTDGDGYNDKQEIDTSNDPNCPISQTCNHTEVIPNGNITASSSNNASQIFTNEQMQQLQQLEQLQGQINSGTTSANSLIDNSGAQISNSTRLNAKDLRAALEKAGFDQSLLNNISDQELIKIYNESLSQSLQQK